MKKASKLELALLAHKARWRRQSRDFLSRDMRDKGNSRERGPGHWLGVLMKQLPGCITAVKQFNTTPAADYYGLELSSSAMERLLADVRLLLEKPDAAQRKRRNQSVASARTKLAELRAANMDDRLAEGYGVNEAAREIAGPNGDASWIKKQYRATKRKTAR